MELYENEQWGHGRRPLAGPVLNNRQHGGYFADYSLRLPENEKWEQQSVDYHHIEVHDSEGTQVGNLHWSKKTGQILDVRVAKEHRRQGVATAMYRMATQLAGERGVAAPKHSNDRSDQGDAWAKAVGGRLPKRIRLEDFPNLR